MTEEATLADGNGVSVEGGKITIDMAAISGLQAQGFQPGSRPTSSPAILKFATPNADALYLGGNVIGQMFVNDVEIPVAELRAFLTSAQDAAQTDGD
jgi:hypothetical protein